jgi:hypothetical protein
VLIAAGEVPLSEEWGSALRSYVQNGGTLVASADQFSGPGAGVLGLSFGKPSEASDFVWTQSGEKMPSNVFRYRALAAGRDRVLAATAGGGFRSSTIAASTSRNTASIPPITHRRKS